MNISYRAFKTFLYRIIPSSFKSQNTEEFSTNDDLVTIFKATEQSGIYENRQVTIGQLSNLVSGEAGPSTFDVTTTGPLTVSVNEGAYSSGPSSVPLGGNFTLAAQNLPTGLTWMGEWSGTEEYANSDVVYNIDGGVYTTWVYINSTPSTGESLPSAPDTFNTYWAQLGTQGPSGSNGVTQLNGVTGNAEMITGPAVFSTNDWRLNIVADAPNSQVALKVNKPYKEFDARLTFLNPTHIPTATSLILGSAVNDFGFNGTNISISQYQGLPGQFQITLPAGSLSTLAAKNIIYAGQDYAGGTTLINDQAWSVKFLAQGFTSTPIILIKVLCYDPTTSNWSSASWGGNPFTLRLTLKVYN